MAASQTSYFMTLMHLVKGNIGTGILALPAAFSNSGLWVGFVGIPLIAFIATHCMHVLVECEQKLRLRFASTFLSYEEVAEKALACGPEPFRKKAAWGQTVVIAFLLLSQIGYCCVYALFVAKNLKQTFGELVPQYADLHVTIFLMAMLPFMILLNCIRSLKYLTLASTCANILEAAGLCIVFVNIFEVIPPLDSVPAIQPPDKLPLYFGTACFAFASIGVVLPLKKDMKKPSTFSSIFGVVNVCMVLSTVLYTVMGFFGYLRYGDDVKGSITLNLDARPMNEAVRMTFAGAIFFSYPLQMYVALQIILPWIRNKTGLEMADPRNTWLEMLFRALLVTGTFLAAGLVPNLDLFISLVGSLCSAGLALVFPPLIEIATHWDHLSEYSTPRRICMWTRNLVIIIFGIIGFLTGTYSSLLEIGKAFAAGDKNETIVFTGSETQ